jgi:hypothetical protein
MRIKIGTDAEAAEQPCGRFAHGELGCATVTGGSRCAIAARGAVVAAANALVLTAVYCALVLLGAALAGTSLSAAFTTMSLPALSAATPWHLLPPQLVVKAFVASVLLLGWLAAWALGVVALCVTVHVAQLAWIVAVNVVWPNPHPCDGAPRRSTLLGWF